MSIESFMNELCTQLQANTQAVTALTVAMQGNVGAAPPAQPPAGNIVAGATVTPGVVDAPVVTEVECDINGMPWDERIHSSAVEADGVSHKKTTKQVWQKKRGVTAELIKQVETELMSTLAGEAAIPSQPGDIPPGTAGAGVGVPPGVGGVVPPGIPPVVMLPMPADINQATHQDCANIVQVFAQLHGLDITAAHLSQWGMTDISQLPVNYIVQFADYMGKEHDKLVAAGA